MSGKIEGRNPVTEAIKSGRPIEKILIEKGSHGLQGIVDLARERGITLQFAENTRAKQGVAAVVAAHEYADIADILSDASFVIVLDSICDPQNLGSILRTANAAGADGIIIPKRNAVGLTETVSIVSAGAVEYTKVAKVPNIAALLDDLKARGFWIYGADMEGSAYYEEKFDGKVALVIGSEGDGISNLVKKKCDFLIRIPMLGKIESLNASVAAGILMYEIVRQRRK